MRRSRTGGKERLPASDRVRKRRDYLEIKRTGTRIPTPLFLALVRTTALDRARLGITVSRRLGGAVQRNHVKRLLREAFRRHKHRLPPSYDVLFIANPKAANASYDQIAGEVDRICQSVLRNA